MSTFVEIIKRCYYIFICYYPSLFCFHVSGTAKKNSLVLEDLKDKYKGKRCFVICNGPSLKPEDLTKIHENDDISIAMNMIARIYDKTSWRPTFLSATDDCVFNPLNKELVENCECGIKLYDRKRYLKSLHAKGNIVYMQFNESRKLLDNPEFDIDVTKPLPSIGTSTYSMIELAGFLGCKEIYLLGCDMSYAVNLNRDGSITYNDSGQNHFYAKEQDQMTHIKPAPTWELQTAFDAAEKLSNKFGIKIYNATRGGKLESFERVDFDTLF